MRLDARIIRHLHSLTSLQWVTVQDDNYVNSTEELWRTLKTDGIQLAHLKTNQMRDDFLQFLSLYGLRDLRLDRISDLGRRRQFESPCKHFRYSSTTRKFAGNPAYLCRLRGQLSQSCACVLFGFFASAFILRSELSGTSGRLLCFLMEKI
jgi:hypothetical protein